VARVCMVAYTIYPADTRIRREAEALVQRGDEVEIVCPDAPSLKGRRALAGVTIHPVSSFDYSRDARPLAYLKRYLSFLVASSAKLLRLHLRRRYDVIHVHTMPDFLVFSALGPKLLGAKVVLDVHDLMPELYASKFSLAETHSIIRVIRAVERLSIRVANRAIAVHHPHLEALIAHGSPRDKFTILMNLPDPALFVPLPRASSSSKFTILYHGMVGSRHGLDVAVSAIARAQRQADNIELRIIGDGDYFPTVRKLVDDLDLSSTVRLEQGLVPVEELIPAIRAASLGIVPILDDPFTRFMLPVKLLEYVALGVPVIASDTATIRSYFDETMIALCVPGDPDDLAEKIVDLHNDPAKRQQLSEAALSFGHEHSWDREKLKYYDLIDSLIGLRPSSDRESDASSPFTKVGET
jgi:glycosyltransferase involved in cell wall biosynthesis